MNDEVARSSSADDFNKLISEMTSSVEAAHNVVRSLLNKHQVTNECLDSKDGISLLTLKNNVLMSYLRSLVLLSSHRLLGNTLSERNSPPEPFASTSRKSRGYHAGDLVDSLVENRVVLEKAKVLESKMRYQMDKLVRMAKQAPGADDANGALFDPLAFRANPDNLFESSRSKAQDGKRRSKNRHSDNDDEGDDAIYRPPRIAPVPYDEGAGKKRRREGPLPAALASLSNYNPSNPHMESTSGLGNDASVVSSRRRELASIERFEEEHLTRLVMSKKEARRRQRDEQDIAFGGTGNTGKFGHAGDFEGEFADILKSIDRKGKSKIGDGYDSLRKGGKKVSALERSRGAHKTQGEILDFGDDGEDTRWKKKPRMDETRRKGSIRKGRRR